MSVQVRTLEGAMRAVLVEMTLLSYGRTQAFASSSGDTEPDARPPGCSYPLADEWRDKWHRSPCEDTLLMARAELDAWKRSVPVETDDSTLEDWVVEDGEGYAVAQVAGKFGLAESRVRRIRMRADRESEFGLPLAFAHHVGPAAKDERVTFLSERGCSWREIAAQTGLHKTQVQRILARQRKAA